jgi:hypothetical protein
LPGALCFGIWLKKIAAELLSFSTVAEYRNARRQSPADRCVIFRRHQSTNAQIKSFCAHFKFKWTDCYLTIATTLISYRLFGIGRSAAVVDEWVSGAICLDLELWSHGLHTLRV